MSVSSILTIAGVQLGSRLILSSVAPDLVANAGVDLTTELVKHGLSTQEAKQKAEAVERLASQVSTDVLNSLNGVELKQTNVQCVADELIRGVVPALTPQFVVSCGMDHGKVITEIKQKHTPSPGTFGHREQALYDRALNVMIERFLPLAAELPAYSVLRDRELFKAARVTGELWRMSVDLSNLDLNNYLKTAQDKQRKSIRKYLDAIEEYHGTLELFGVDHTPIEAQQYSMRKGLVDIRITRDFPRTASGLHTDERDQDQYEPLRLIVRGTAGSGKTTLMRSVAVRCAQECRNLLNPTLKSKVSPSPIAAYDTGQPSTIEGDLSRLAGRTPLPSELVQRLLGIERTGHGRSPQESHTPSLIPFLIRLRDCEDGKLPDRARMGSLSCAVEGILDEELINDILDKGLGLVIFDGIDEVPPRDRVSLHEQVRVLMKIYPQSHFILTSRPLAEAEPSWLIQERFLHGWMEELSKEKRNLLIDRWHDAVSEQLAKLKRPDGELKALPTKLKSALDNAPAIARLATNPLMCAMICSLHRTRKYLPENLNDLLAALSEMLIYKREEQSPGFRPKRFDNVYAKLAPNHRRNILSHLALFFVMEDKSRMDRQRVLNKMAEKLKSILNFEDADPEDVLKGLTERCGLIREASPTTIEFIHNTIKEYLAATRYVAEDARTKLVECADDEAGANVVVFAVAANDEKTEFTEEVLEKLLLKIRSCEHGPFSKPRKAPLNKTELANRVLAYRRAVVAIRAWQVRQTTISTELQQGIDQLISKLFPPASAEVASALADVGASVIPHLGYNPQWPTLGQALSARVLRLLNSTDARAKLDGYRNCTAPEVLDELVRCMDPLSIPGVVRLFARTQAELDEAENRNFQLTESQGQVMSSAHSRIESCEAIKGRNDIVQLDLYATSITDAGISPIADPVHGLHCLRDLDLGHTQVSDDGLRWIARSDTPLKRLRSLNLIGARQIVNPIGILSDASCGVDSLRAAYFEGPGVDDGAVRMLVAPNSKLRGLEELTLAGTELTDRGLKSLLSGTTRLQQLKELEVISPQITHRAFDDYLVPSCDVTRLNVLTLAGTEQTDTIAQVIAEIPQLSESLTDLTLRGSGLRGDGLKALGRTSSKLRQLTTLSICAIEFTFEDLEVFIGPATVLQKLKYLWIQAHFTKSVLFKFLAEAPIGLPQLEELVLEDAMTDTKPLNPIRLKHPTWRVNGLRWADVKEG